MKIQLALLVLISLTCSMLGDMAYAQAQIPAGTCTTDPTFQVSTGTYLVTEIVNNISCILYGSLSPHCGGGRGVAEAMFTAISTDSGFMNTVRAAVALYIVIYAISFTLGMVQITITDFAMRVLKIGIAIILISPSAWLWFYGTVGYFFKDGADWLIGVSTQIAVGVPSDPQRPFLLIDKAVNEAFSARMFVTLVATFGTGPYGLVLALLMILSIGTFVAALFQALWVYLMALVVRAFLFGLAPIFFPMLLFSKTQHLFFNWLNQLVYTMLAPAFLFTFFSFFMVLMSQAMQNILGICVCYMPGTGLFRGSPMDEVWPRFCVNGSPYGGAWGWNGPVDFPGTPFPIDIMNLLMFLLLAQLAWRFNGIALNVAREISSASIQMASPSISNPFGGGGAGGAGAGGKAAGAAASSAAKASVAAGGAGGAAAGGGAGANAGSNPQQTARQNQSQMNQGTRKPPPG